MYAKLFTSIYQGTLRGNAHGLLVFTNLLAHCDKHGEVDIHPRAIAEEVGLTVDQVRVALGMLEAADGESRSPDLDGRRIVRLDEHRDWGWCVVNYLKYRAIRDEDDRREQNRLAQERWRNKNKPASAAVGPNQPIQKQKQIQKKEKQIPASKPAKPSVETVSRETLIAAGFDEKQADDFLACKLNRKAPLTPRAWEDHKREAAKAGWTPAQAAEKVMAKTWKGFEAKYVADDAKPRTGTSSAFAGAL